MLRAFSFVLLTLTLLASGCYWAPVAYEPQPGLVTHPVDEIKALLKLRSYPAAVVEVTDEAIKEFFAGYEDSGVQVLPLAGTSFRIITRDDMYMVAAYDGGGREIWTYRPPGDDLPTCRRMMNALYAVAKRRP